MSKELGTLVVVVLKAQNLIDNHTFYKQDPYAKLSLSGATKQTPPDPKGGQHPVWDAELRFPISKDASKNNRTLTISVFSEEKKNDELLGESSVDITDTLKSGEFDDWVPLSLKGTQRGEVYLEMTFFAAGPAPLTRRPTKFTSPSERLGRPQQPITQHPQRVTSQPPSSPLSPQGQQGSRLNAQEAPRPGPHGGQQVRLPGAWPGPSAQHELPPLPPDPEPKQEFVPSILRPGGPSRSGNTSPNGHLSQPHPGQQNALPLPGSSASQSHISPSSPSLEAQPSHAQWVSSYPGQGIPGQGGYASSGHPTTQPSPHTQLESPHVHHTLPSQPSPPLRHQTQHPASQPAPPSYASPYPPNNHSAAQIQAPHSSTLPVPSYVATQSPAPSTYSYVPTPGPSPPVHSHIAGSGHVSLNQPHAATLGPVPAIHPHTTSISAAPPSPPPHSYPMTSGRPPAAHSSPTPAYTASPVPFTSPYPAAPMSPGPPTQPYVSPLGPVLTHPTQSHLSPSSSPPHTQSFFSPPNAAVFPQLTSPPPISSYGHTPTPSFPMPSFPVPQPTVDYFGGGRGLSPSPPAPFLGPSDEPELPDPYLLERYRTPLPLPPGSNPSQSTHAQQPKTKPPAPAAAAAAPSSSSRLQDESERAAREMLRREEESERVRREQEERDAELARTLDLELNMDGDGNGAGARGEPGRPSLPPRRAEPVGGHRSAMPGAW